MQKRFNHCYLFRILLQKNTVNDLVFWNDRDMKLLEKDRKENRLIRVKHVLDDFRRVHVDYVESSKILVFSLG